jgi:xanthine dehydrogenase accessory factor
MDQANDTEVLRAASDWLQQGDRVILVTVASTWGSAPRRPGALMAIAHDGRWVGSVSGGCVEDDLIQRCLRGEFEARRPRLLEYGVGAAQAGRVGLPCGGRLALLVEPLTSLAALQPLLDAMEDGRRLARQVRLDSGAVSLAEVTEGTGCQVDGDVVTTIFGPAWRMLIIGAGELPRRVAQLALTLDYGVTLCDPRPEYASGWQVDGAGFSVTPPERLIPQLAPDCHTVVLALAHAPPLEDAALVAALRSDAGYVGALGSRRNQQARLQRLAELGVTPEQLARLKGPVGLDIGSRTPAEIAVAIAADLVQARNRTAHQPLQDASLARTGHG